MNFDAIEGLSEEQLDELYEDRELISREIRLIDSEVGCEEDQIRCPSDKPVFFARKCGTTEGALAVFEGFEFRDSFGNIVRMGGYHYYQQCRNGNIVVAWENYDPSFGGPYLHYKDPCIPVCLEGVCADGRTFKHSSCSMWYETTSGTITLPPGGGGHYGGVCGGGASAGGARFNVSPGACRR